MTPWRYIRYLFLFVFLIDVSKENCYDYFNVSEWSLTKTYTLIPARNPKDYFRCTLVNECRKKRNRSICYVLQHCYEDDLTDQQKESWNKSECYNETSGEVSIYNLMCAIAKDVNYTAIGCHVNDFEHFCPLYSLDKKQQAPAATTLSETTLLKTSSPTRLSGTTTPSPTTLSETTTLSKTTASSPTTLSETTPSPTTLSETTTKLETTPSPTTLSGTTTLSETTPSSTTLSETTLSETTPSRTTLSETTPSRTTLSETTPSPTTLSETTPSSTTLSETTLSETTPSRTTLSETTPSPTTLSETASSKTTERRIFSPTSQEKHENRQGTAQANNKDTVKDVILVISVSLNLALPLAVYLYMRQTKRAMETQTVNSMMLLTSACNKDVEATELLQAVTPIYDATSSQHIAGDESMQTIL